MSTNSYRIARLYLKSASIEVPDMARVPRLAVQPDIGVDFQTDVKPAWAGHIECTLTISLHGKLNGKTMFMIEVGQAGVFKVPAGTTEQIARFAKVKATEVLFPYARKHLAAMAVSAGFQPVILDHADFGALLSKLTKQPKPALQPVADRNPSVQAAGRTPTLSVQHARPIAKQSPGGAQTLNAPIASGPASAAPPAAARSRPTMLPLPAALRQARPLAVVSIIALFAAACAIWIWPGRAGPVAASARPAASIAAIPAAERKKQDLIERGERIIAASQARLADQARNAFTLELGTISSADAIPALEGLALQRALFVDRRADGSLAVLYGIFPEASLALAAESELTHQFPAALALRTQVLRLGDANQQSQKLRQ